MLMVVFIYLIIMENGSLKGLILDTMVYYSIFFILCNSFIILNLYIQFNYEYKGINYILAFHLQ
jgi:hypothetical protein